MRSGIEVMHTMARNVVRNILGTITNVVTEEPIVALTFDDGPDPIYTPRVLSILNRYRAHATFFMVGQCAEKHQDLVRQISMSGHSIGNHSWNHPSFPLISRHERRMQIDKCSRAIAPYGQKLFRPPYGDLDTASHIDLLLSSYKVVTWNLLAGDWQGREGDCMAHSLLGRMHSGCIILFHDSLYDFVEERFSSREQMLKALEILLQQGSQRFSFVTVPELLKQGRPQLTYWRQKPSVGFLNTLKRRSGRARHYLAH